MFLKIVYFYQRIKNVIIIIYYYKTIGLLCKLQNTLPRQTLITIYKAFLRHQIDYGDSFYKQTYNASFHQKLEKIQYNACITIKVAIRGT